MIATCVFSTLALRRKHLLLQRLSRKAIANNFIFANVIWFLSLQTCTLPVDDVLSFCPIHCNMSKPIKVAVLRSPWPNCTFEVPPCVIPSKNLEIVGVTRFIASLLQPEGYNTSDVRFLPATSYTTQTAGTIALSWVWYPLARPIFQTTL